LLTIGKRFGIIKLASSKQRANIERFIKKILNYLKKLVDKMMTIW